MSQPIVIPDDLMVRIEATAQAKGKSTTTIVAEAISQYMESVADAADAPPWLPLFGAMAHLGAEEHARIRREIEDAFEQIEPEQWQ